MSAMSAPIPDSYWVKEGALIAGEYPGAPDDERARSKLGALLDAGVTYFLDLTSAEDPLRPYDQVLREIAERDSRKTRYSRQSVRDGRCPSVVEMRDILDEIDRVVAEGHCVYVHCWGGVGRTGTVVGCHLVRQGSSGEEALDEVARLFATMSEKKLAVHPRSPQTSAQREFILSWKENDRR